MKSMTYGVMPTKKEFAAHWKGHMDSGEGYPYTLRGSDAATAYAARVPTSGEFSEKQLYAIIKKLRDRSYKGDENAGSIASSILYNLGFEWI